MDIPGGGGGGGGGAGALFILLPPRLTIAPAFRLGYVFDDAINGSGGGKNWGVLNILENLASNDPESPECS